MLGGEEGARQIDLESSVPAFERNARGRPLFAEYAGIVEADIKAAIALLGTLLRREATTTLVPARANSFADARPMPALAPVTMATLSLRSTMRKTGL